jgi:hypothetical protein
MIDVYTYDASCNVLTQPFYFVSEDLSGGVLAVSNAGAIGTRWGAQLMWAARQVDTYRVVITDPQMKYTTLVIGDFNAAGGGTFEVIVQKLPPAGSLSGGGSGASGWSDPASGLDDGSTLSAIYTQIGEQPDWTDEEKEGVRMLIIAYVAVADHPAVQAHVSRWEMKLEELGVPVAALNAASKSASATLTV